MIEVQHLGCQFGDFALDDVSLRIGKGEYWVLLGPSGCGKSVLLQTLAGFFQPTAGRILVDGREVTAQAPERRNIGLVFQQAALFPHLSVRGNIEYGLHARRVPQPEARRTVDELVERLGLAAVLARPVATLSGGEAQRVAIARALAVRPVLLLLDEPLSSLDHNARLELQAELARWHKELDLTTLHVTHSRDEAAALGDFLAVMLGARSRVVPSWRAFWGWTRRRPSPGRRAPRPALTSQDVFPARKSTKKGRADGYLCTREH
jgi:ABC-type Fe3+/spermidine/putrescine transport system ATPase subunit